MKKLLFVLATLFMAGNAMADRVVTFTPSDFTEMTSAGAYSAEKEGIIVSVSDGMAKKSHIRIYKNSTLNIELAEVPATHIDNVGISCVEIDCIGEDDDQYGPGNFSLDNDFRGEYSYDGYTGTWVDTEIEISEAMQDIFYEHAIAVSLLASGAQVRADEIRVYIIGEDDPEPPTPGEKTDAPSSQKENYVYNDGNLYYNAYTVTLIETEPSDIYYRIGIMGEDGQYAYGDWMLYTGPFNVEEEGTYMIEAYAIAPDKAESDHIWDGFVVSKAVSVDELITGKTVSSVRYFNVAGQEMQQANGLTIQVTTYTDGTTSAVKVVK